MSVLAAHALKLFLIDKKNNLQYKIIELDRKLSDLQEYSSSIGDQTLSMQDMMNVPSSVFHRAMAFMNYSHNGALQGAQMNMQMMGPQIQAQMAQMQTQSDPNAMAQYNNWIFRNLYNQELAKYQKHEAKLLNQQEKEKQKEKASISTQIQIIDQQMATADQQTKEGIQSFKA